LKNQDVMNVAFLSLGGNLKDRLEIIEVATKAIGALCGKITGISSIYETDAWGSDSEKKYLNRVLKIETKLSANQLLKQTRLVETQAGRKRKDDRNADRILDIDLLFFNKAVIHSKELQIPHPRLELRKFILVPLNEIEKTWVHPIFKKTVHQLLKDCTDHLSVELFNQSKFPRYICIEGNIGSGKSTLARALQKHWHARLLPEIYEDNGLLPLFYDDPKMYAFSLEYGFLMNRFEEITKQLKNKNNTIVSDYSFYKCLYYAEVNLPAKEFTMFKKHFKTLLKLLPKPDLIVYLDAKTNTLLQNIKKRGRPYEQNMKRGYLTSLEKAYKQGLAESKDLKKLVIGIKTYNVSLETALIKKIDKYIKENFGTQAKTKTI